MKVYNFFSADRPAFMLAVLVFMLVCINVGRAARSDPIHSLMEYFVMAIDCLAMVGSRTELGWQTLLYGLEHLVPIDHRTRPIPKRHSSSGKSDYGSRQKTHLHYNSNTASKIEDTLAFKWNDYVLTQFVSVLIKDSQGRGNFIIKSYFRCKHITQAVIGKSRCDNTLMFLVCLRALGVSFLLVDKSANLEQGKFVTRTVEEEEMAKRLLEVNQLQLQFARTTLRLTPDVTVLQGFRAEAFWNAFDGDQKRIGMMKDDCSLSPSTNTRTSTLNPNLVQPVGGPENTEISVNKTVDPTPKKGLAPSPGSNESFGVGDYIEPV